MALTLRSNGTAGGIVSAAWWNDYYNLLTGVMTDQLVTLASTPLTLSATSAGIEIGSTSAAGTPYIDFHSSGNALDYDARLMASGGDASVGDAGLSVHAASFTWLTSASYGLIINDNSPNVQMVAQAPGGQARGFTLAGIDSAGVGHAGLQVNSDGSVEVSVYDTSSGALQLVKFFSGTATPPTSAPDGSWWLKG